MMEKSPREANAGEGEAAAKKRKMKEYRSMGNREAMKAHRRIEEKGSYKCCIACIDEEARGGNRWRVERESESEEFGNLLRHSFSSKNVNVSASFLAFFLGVNI